MQESFYYNVKGKNEDIAAFMERISEGIRRDMFEDDNEDEYEELSIPRFLVENSNDLFEYWDDSTKDFTRIPGSVTSITIGSYEELNYGYELDFQEMNYFMIQNAKNLTVLGEYSNSIVSYEICFMLRNGVSKQIDNFCRDAYLEDLDVIGDAEILVHNPWFGKDFEELFCYAKKSGIDITDPDQRMELIEEHEFSGLREILEKAYKYDCEPLSDSICLRQ